MNSKNLPEGPKTGLDLRQGLLSKDKPRHQFQDETSLSWLTSHRPGNLPLKHKVKDESAHLVEKLSPWSRIRDDWFTDELILKGIHGFRHCARVAINAVLLTGKRTDFSPEEVEALMFAALIHDCRRENDNADVDHGRRAASWAEKEGVLPARLVDLSDEVIFSIRIHNDPYEKFVRNPEYRTSSKITDVLKTADALDRYRFPREDWWLNQNLIRYLPDQQDMAFAFDLMLYSEKEYFMNKDCPNSVRVGWKKCVSGALFGEPRSC